MGYEICLAEILLAMRCIRGSLLSVFGESVRAERRESHCGDGRRSERSHGVVSAATFVEAAIHGAPPEFVFLILRIRPRATLQVLS